MKWVRDRTGRFPERPHYLPAELDDGCEQLMEAFLKQRHGSARYPISTEDLTVLIESKASDLDLYADLSGEVGDVEGVTEFLTDDKPRVRIAAGLTQDARRENRLRTTLTHELGHVEFHSFLFALPRPDQLFALPEAAQSDRAAACRRETILETSMSDWMEWQAGYACGAFLMPLTALRSVVRSVFEELGIAGPTPARSSAAERLIASVQLAFRVSSEAARVRLTKLGHLSSAQTETGDPLLRAI